MRAPRRKRPQPRQVVDPPADTNLAEVAERVSYVGSPEHKDGPSFAGQPRPRADASICERQLTEDRELITQWLREAIRRGATGGIWESGFPRYAWHKEAGSVYEARLVNSGLGEYKGYPLNETEWPVGLGSVYE
jgi:hypothetical protein